MNFLHTHLLRLLVGILNVLPPSFILPRALPDLGAVGLEGDAPGLGAADLIAAGEVHGVEKAPRSGREESVGGFEFRVALWRECLFGAPWADSGFFFEARNPPSKRRSTSNTWSNRWSTRSNRRLFSACVVSKRRFISVCKLSIRALTWLNMVTIATIKPANST